MMKSRIYIMIWYACSLVAGLVAYHFSAYNAATVVLEATSLEPGTGKLVVTGYDGRKQTRSFELNGKYGIRSSEPGKMMHVIELPATKIKGITIEPLARPGFFEIHKLTVSDGATSYSWDDRNICSKKIWLPLAKKVQSCEESSSPQIKIAADGTVEILSPGGIGRENSTVLRSAMAAFAMICCWFCFRFLRTAFHHEDRQEKWRKIGVTASWLAVTLVYLYQLSLVCRYAMDVPYYDEWDYFDLRGKLCIPDSLSVAWLFDFWSEHIIVPTKLMVWLNLKLFALNLVYDKIENYILYGMLLLAIIVMKNSLLKKGDFAWFPVFMLFLLSPLAHQNHLWGFQSQTHFFLLLSIVPLCFVYRNPAAYMTAAVFYLLLTANIFTFGAGVVVSLVYMACYTVYITAGVLRKQIDSARGWKIITAGVLLMAPCLYFRFHGYEKAGWTPVPVSPLEMEFWAYLSNIVSLGAGFTTINIIPGLVWMLIILIPLTLLLKKPETRWHPSTWSVIAGIFGMIAVLAAISYGRGGFNEPKTSRYAEYGMMLIPLAALAWWLALEGARSRLMVLSSLWIALFVNFSDTWSAQPYREKRQMDIFHLECIESYFEGTGDGVCQGDKRGLDRAAQLGVSFTRQFMTSAVHGGKK